MVRFSLVVPSFSIIFAPLHFPLSLRSVLNGEKYSTQSYVPLPGPPSIEYPLRRPGPDSTIGLHAPSAGAPRPSQPMNQPTAQPREASSAKPPRSLNLVAFSAEAAPPAALLARLHAELLPRSPLSHLGPRFMEKFYYSWLPRDGRIFGWVAYVDEQPAGFITATENSEGFMGLAIRRRWPWLGWTLFTSLVLSPRRLRPTWEAIQLMRTRDPEARGRPEGEILSFGVLPEFRSPKFIRKSGHKIGAELMARAIERLGEMKAPVVRAIVDADNRLAQLFYHSQGWELTRDDVPGWREATWEFSLELSDTKESKPDSTG